MTPDTDKPEALYRLRELAQAAECGQWVFDGNEVVAPDHELSIDVLPVLIADPSSSMGPYIAAANPTAILSLLDTLAAQDAEIAAMREALRGIIAARNSAPGSGQYTTLQAIEDIASDALSAKEAK